MMMSLGQFVFSLPTLAFQQLQRQRNWRHADTSRVGARPANQFLGPGADTITLTGVVLPEFGNRAGLVDLAKMADTGAAWPLVDGRGAVYGQWTITDMSEDGSLFDRKGQAKRIGFTLNLKRVDDDRVDRDRSAL